MFERLFHLHHAEDGAITLVNRLIDAHFYRVNFEVTTVKSFPYLAFPHFLAIEKTPKLPSFDGELMASFGPRLRNLPGVAGVSTPPFWSCFWPKVDDGTQDSAVPDLLSDVWIQ